MELDDFSKYMNKPECPVKVGHRYKRTDLLDDSTVYTVKEIIETNNKFYALCSYIDPFDEEETEEKVYCFYLVDENAL